MGSAQTELERKLLRLPDGAIEPRGAILNPAVLILQLVLSIGLFALDILTPSGTADGIGYSVIIALCLWHRDARVAAVWTALSAALIIGGWSFSQYASPGTGVTARLLAIGTVLLIYALIRSRVKITEALRQQQIEASRANDAKTSFLANMSHELRTPLNAIIGFSELMGTNGVVVTEEKRREYLLDIHGSAYHLLAIVSDLLDMAKNASGQLKLNEREFSLNELVDEAVQWSSNAATKKQIHLSVETGELPYLHADPRLVRQTILNLLSNGVKFTRSGGRVTVTTGCSKGGLWFAVSDTGIGIPQSMIPELAHPFQRASSAVSSAISGTGLGLALCRQFAEAHGGSLHIHSVENEGTTVRVSFPARRTVGAETAVKALAAA